MTSAAVRAGQQKTFAETPLLPFDCPLTSLDKSADNAVGAARHHSTETDCALIAECIDRVCLIGDRADNQSRHNAPAAGVRARDAITLRILTLSPGEAVPFPACQRRSGAHSITSSTSDTPGANGRIRQAACPQHQRPNATAAAKQNHDALRHLEWYVRRFGVHALQMLFLPAVSVGVLLAAICMDHPR
ncbi:hypothetical protein GCM10010129_76310 [Streptomyces fumigatiscleroticus]|nr:hypothetical protein GCM10010129_76310 [Streptomyces fumigatiscleroticus]